jgi:hypothetical protein
MKNRNLIWAALHRSLIVSACVLASLNLSAQQFVEDSLRVDGHMRKFVMFLPADMKPGDKLPDGRGTVKTGVMTHSREIIEREVLRYERVTVPAGTFDCIVVREHKIERGIGRNRDTLTENWYAPGIGPVRHDSYNYNNGNPTFGAREVLKKY